MLLRADACFYDGDLFPMFHLYRNWSTLPKTLRPHLFVALHNHHRLRTLSQCTEIIWKRAGHVAVGGVTSAQVWFGFSMPTLLMPDAHPKLQYCKHVLRDVLEFAPSNQFTAITNTGIKEDLWGKFEKPVLFGPVPNTYCSNGILPLFKKPCTSLPRVVCSCAFTASKVCLRSFTTKELTRFLDLPVAFEKRLQRAWSDQPNITCPLLEAIPLKLLQHALYVSSVIVIWSSTDDSEAGNADVGGELLVASHKINNNDKTSDSQKADDRNIPRNDQQQSLLVSQHLFQQNSVMNQVDIKATKEDGAAVPTYLWNDAIAMKSHDVKHATAEIVAASDILRKYMLKVWKRKVLHSFVNYLTKLHAADYFRFKLGERQNLSNKFQKDLQAGRDCIYYAGASTWWEWSCGSRLFFWRWPKEFKIYARDGIPVCWVNHQRPANKRPQSLIIDKDTKYKMKEKISKVRNKRYVQPGPVASLIRYFPVPKGEDIQMVYNGTDSGFNEMVWIPSFRLPTINTLLRGTSPTTWMVDLDISEMFLNFVLDEDASKYVGIDLTPIFGDKIKEENQRVIWERYTRCAMGLAVSPNHTIRATLIAEEFLTGLPWDFNNPFHYNEVRLNLPGTISYVPNTPWFSLHRYDDQMASILAIYVDDERCHAPTQELAVKCARQVGSRETYLGIQDAARKRRPPSQQAGAWAGSIIHTNGKEVGVLVSQERWNKTRRIIQNWLEILKQDEELELCTEILFSDRGYLVYVSRTYDVFTTYLKGIHLTLDGWRANRDENGWKSPELQAHLDEERRGNEGNRKFGRGRSKLKDYPETVRPVPRLLNDLKALSVLTQDEVPPVLLVQSEKVCIAKYMFGDASGSGFGTSCSDGLKTEVEFGTWTEQGAENSSNYREFANFVMKLEVEGSRGRLTGAEMFLFTDNSTTESAFCNGTSSSQTLFELVLRIKVVQLKYGTKIHVIHVSGTRMISQGTDGLSRGNLFEGVLTDGNMLKHIPIQRGACERSPELLKWIRKWTDEPGLSPLRPDEWIWRGQGLAPYATQNPDGMEMPCEGEEDLFLWSPAPCLADVALEYIRKSIHKRPHLTHICVIPKLMTPNWRKHMLKNAQFSFYIDVGHEFWQAYQHESLLICCFFPQLPCPPWTIKRTPKVLAMDRCLHEVQKRQDGSECALLLKFWRLVRKLPTMPHGVVQKVLSSWKIGQVSHKQALR